jgi:hypothetical protein
MLDGHSFFDDAHKWSEMRVLRLLEQYVSNEARTSTFVDSNDSWNTTVQRVTALAVFLLEIFTKNSRLGRENWVHIQHYFQGVPPRPVTFFK